MEEVVKKGLKTSGATVKLVTRDLSARLQVSVFFSLGI